MNLIFVNSNFLDQIDAATNSWIRCKSKRKQRHSCSVCFYLKFPSSPRNSKRRMLCQGKTRRADSSGHPDTFASSRTSWSLPTAKRHHVHTHRYFPCRTVAELPFLDQAQMQNAFLNVGIFVNT